MITTTFYQSDYGQHEIFKDALGCRTWAEMQGYLKAMYAKGRNVATVPVSPNLYRALTQPRAKGAIMRKKECLTKKQALVFRAAVITAIQRRRIRQKDIVKASGTRPQHVYDVLHSGKPLSRRMHAAIMKVMRPVFERMAA